MAELTYREAVADAIAQEMERDDKVVFLGEDIAKAGGVVEVQGTAEDVPFQRRQFEQLLNLAEKGVAELCAAQAKALGLE